jgi:prepilin signal peptidase PulO-like enzyme (type II secretory pathway)
MHDLTLIGLIMMLVIGPAVGNYACSVVYRLPLGKTPFERHPFCGSCDKNLQPIDLFPIVSWFLTKGKCRYCQASIPSIYTVIEFACLAIFVGYFLRFGVSELFILYAAYGTFVVILAAIHWQQGWISQSIYTYALVCIALARTLDEGKIYGWLHGGFIMLVIVVGLMRVTGNKASPFEKPWVWWFVLLGALIPMKFWPYIVALYIFKLAIPKKYRVIVYSAAALIAPALVV